FGFVDDPDRVGHPAKRENGAHRAPRDAVAPRDRGLDADRNALAVRHDDGAADGAVEIGWDDAIVELTSAPQRYPAHEIAVIASPEMSNEDLLALRRVVQQLGVTRVAFRVPTRAPGDEDDLLIKADKHPNTRGAELVGVDGDTAAILASARAGEVKCLWV